MGKHHINAARSGVQYYLSSELPTLGLWEVPREFAHLRVLGVYRPANVLRKALPLFKNVPLVVGHDKRVFTGKEDYIIGHGDDNPELTMVNDEATIYLDCDIDEARRPRYDEVSVGYKSRNHWQPGTTRDGEEFQIICDGIDSVEHLAFVPNARGGKYMKVLDGGGKLIRKIQSGLLRFAHAKVQPVQDASADDFCTRINMIETGIDKMSDSDIDHETQALLAMTTDLPDSIEKDKLVRFLADVPILLGETPEVIHEALDAIASLYNKLAADAVAEGMGVQPMMPTAQNPANPQVPNAAPAIPPAATQPPAQSAVQAPAPAPASTPASTQSATAAPAAAPTSDPMTMILQMLQQILSRLDGGNSGGSEPPKAEAPKDGGSDNAPPSEPKKDDSSSDKPSDTQPTQDGGDVIIVTPASVKADNPTDTEVPEAAKGGVAEQAMTPDGVVEKDTGALRNQAEKEKETDKDEPKPATQVATATVEIPVEVKPIVGDAMPQYTQTLDTIKAGESLDNLFSKMKERK